MADCAFENLGLTQSDFAALTGFTRRAVEALAHLREAWAVADDSNRFGIAMAIRAVCLARSMAEKRALCAAVLTFDLDEQAGAELLECLQ